MPRPAAEGKPEYTGASVRARAGFVLLTVRGASRASGDTARPFRAVAELP
jgi:hypothetical protein